MGNTKSSTSHESGEEEDTESGQEERYGDRVLIPSGNLPENLNQQLPDRYQDVPDAKPSRTAAVRVTEGDKQFLEDLVDVHPDFDSVNALFFAWVRELQMEHGERVSERVEQLQQARESF